MKISNSKKELARIISENGGWRDGNYAVQDKDDKKVWFMRALAGRPDGASFWPGVKSRGIPHSKVLTNWHQTILSRAEYLHLYPAPDADGWIEWNGGDAPVGDSTYVDVKLANGHEYKRQIMLTRSWRHDNVEFDVVAYRLHKPEPAKSTAVGDNETNLAAKEELEAMEYRPSIEQLMQIHCDRAHALGEKKAELLVAERQESEALDALKAACREAGFDISPAEKPQEKQEPELVITDWRDLRVGDLVVITGSGSKAWSAFEGKELSVARTGCSEDELMFISEDGDGWYASGNTQWDFIRRP